MDALQILHSWRVTRVSAHFLEMVYDNQLKVSVPCLKYRPDVSGIRISHVEEHSRKKVTDSFPIFSAFAVDKAQRLASAIPSESAKSVRYLSCTDPCHHSQFCSLWKRLVTFGHHVHCCALNSLFLPSNILLSLTSGLQAIPLT